MRGFSVVLIAGLLALAAAAANAGMYYEAVTRGEGREGADMVDSRVKAWVSGDKAKIVFAESKNPMTEEGTYIVTKDGGKTMYLVNPKEKTYAVWDMDAFLGMAGGMMKMARGMMNLKFSQPKVEKLLEEAGGAMLGLPTTHYRYRTNYTMSMSFMGMKNETRTEQLQDTWATSKLLEAAFGVWLRNEPPKTGDEELDAMIAAEVSKVHGVPLKSITVTTSTDTKKGKTETSTVTTEVTKLEAASMADSEFEVPAGYEETQLLPTGEEGEGSEEGEQNPLAKMFGGKKKG